MEQRERRPLGGVVAKLSGMGRTQEQVICPFCQRHVWTYVWSRCGNGKRCECGALLCRTVAFAPKKRTKMKKANKDWVDDHGVTKPGRRCKGCDHGVYDKDTKCSSCGSTTFVDPYPPATTLEMAVAEIFEHDTKRSGIVDGIPKVFTKKHGVDVLSGMVASAYERGTGTWLPMEECKAAVLRGLEQRKKERKTG